MKLARVLVGSLRILLGNRLRSFLAISGVGIGIALVMVTSALGEGARTELLRGVDPMGARLLVVRAATTKTSVSRRNVKGTVTSLKREDCVAIEDLGSVERAAPVLDGQLKVRSDSGTTLTKVVGTTDSLLAVRGYGVGQGRFFTADEEAKAARVSVLGARIAERLFPGASPVGQTIRIRGVPFDVVGVLRPNGASADGSDHDSQILLPLRTAQRRLYDSRSLTFIYVTTNQPELLGATERAVTTVLRQRHRLTMATVPDDFTFQSQAKAADVRSQLAGSLDLLKGGFGVVAMAIGGAGILALMLLSVQERTGEIALRIAVGAKSRDVAIQFLFESLLLAISGGILGICMGSASAAAVAYLTEWQVQFSVESLILPCALSLATGISAGVLPASKAARIAPIQAFAQQ